MEYNNISISHFHQLGIYRTAIEIATNMNPDLSHFTWNEFKTYLQLVDLDPILAIPDTTMSIQRVRCRKGEIKLTDPESRRGIKIRKIYPQYKTTSTRELMQLPVWFAPFPKIKRSKKSKKDTQNDK